MNDHLTSPGGWCVPYGTGPDWRDVFVDGMITLPEVSVARGSITYTRPEPGTKAYAEMKAREAEQTTIQELIARHVGNILHAQNAAMDAAVITALHNGWEAHFQRNWASRFIGIDLRPRRPSSALVCYHDSDGYWELLEDDEDD